MDEDELVPIILGRPFLATARATEEEEGDDSNEVFAVSYYPRTEPVEPLERKASENRLKPSSMEPPKLELKELHEHIEYAFLQENNQLPVVISSALSIVKKTRLLETSFKPVPTFKDELTHHQRRFPKKGGMTVVKNEKDELIPQRTIIGWRMLKRLVRHEYYCFLDGFYGYFQIPISPEDQEKTTLTCPYWTFAYKRMPFGLCNALTTFQRCMIVIFHELIEDSMEVFMDDFSIFGSSFNHCLKNLEKMLKRCEETNLVLNWEKCHFMVKEGIILDHKVLSSGIEVDKAKIEAISKLPYSTNVKAIQSFLEHAGFYKRIIKDFSQIARLMTQLLVKDAPFNFIEECIQAFDTLKRELTQAPIMIKPDWSLPFEIMCDARDYVVGAIRDKKGAKNLAVDHLSRLKNPDLGKLTKAEIRDLFPEERLMEISDKSNEPCGPSRGHNSIATTVRKVFKSGFYWPHIFRDARKLVQVCDACQRAGNISSKDEIPQKYIQVEAQAFPTNDAQNVVNFLKRLFTRFGIPKALISDRGTHFCNHQMEKAMKRNNRKDWSYKLDDALWAFWTAFKTPFMNDPINELDEMRLDAYESSISYKERTKRWHDKRIKLPINYERGDKVLLFNSRLRLFPGKLKSTWYGPFSVSKDMKNGAIKLYDEKGSEFIVDKQRVKPYQKNVLDTNRDDDITLEDQGEVT
ncbi:reverse transcriptase domain-containing protein [Tanacetum coccineum]